MVRKEIRLTVAIAAMIALGGGCSAARAIASNANTIHIEAADIVALSQDIERRAADDFIRAAAAAIGDKAKTIQAAAQTIHATLPGVVDRVPWWGSLLTWISIAAAGIAVAWVLHSSGALVALRVAINWLPRKKITDAEMAASALATDQPETMREYIAMRRGSDALFAAAWKQNERTNKSP